MDDDAAPSTPRGADEGTTLAQEVRGSFLLLGLSFGVTAVVVTGAQAAAALLG